MRAVWNRFLASAGGPEQARVVLVLGAVLALDTADKGAISATVPDLEAAFSVGHTDIGLLLTVGGVVGAGGSLVFGSLVDRVDRTRLLLAVVALWSASVVAEAISPSFTWLLASRAGLGALTAAAYPAVLSLVGDWFPDRSRGHVLGMVISGELIGTGVGVALAGSLASLSSWRIAYLVLVVPSGLVMWLLHRTPEPERGGNDRRTTSSPEADGRTSDRATSAATGARGRHQSLWRSTRQILSIRTNVVLIAASSLAYYLFAGVRAFGVTYVIDHFGIARTTASLLLFVLGAGGLAGVMTGGRLADHLQDRGRRDARLLVPAVALLALGTCLTPAVVVTSVALALPLFVAAAFFFGVSTPPLDAARLDVVPSNLWGRAEAIRSVTRMGLEAAAPLAFGALAQHVFAGPHGDGLEPTFVVMVVPLAVAAVVLLLARHRYVVDAARARGDASEDEAPEPAGAFDPPGSPPSSGSRPPRAPSTEGAP